MCCLRVGSAARRTRKRSREEKRGGEKGEERRKGGAYISLSRETSTRRTVRTPAGRSWCALDSQSSRRLDTPGLRTRFHGCVCRWSRRSARSCSRATPAAGARDRAVRWPPLRLHGRCETSGNPGAQAFETASCPGFRNVPCLALCVRTLEMAVIGYGEGVPVKENGRTAVVVPREHTARAALL
ncbi:hypothetical protein C8J57DRAFT_1383369 [Mycena rebaudengoi]|nr:hypothetical protein C8J57DRAFT_1383369 [Mycena rebaudengoi]